MESTSKAIGVPSTTFFRQYKYEGCAVRHTSALKPLLSEYGKHKRVLFALSKIDSNTINGTRQVMKYSDDSFEINLDENKSTTDLVFTNALHIRV